MVQYWYKRSRKVMTHSEANHENDFNISYLDTTFITCLTNILIKVKSYVIYNILTLLFMYAQARIHLSKKLEVVSP